MMSKMIPSIEKDTGMQTDAVQYAARIIKNLRVDGIEVAIEHAYRRGAINSFATGYRIGYKDAEKDWSDAVNLYKKFLDNIAEETYENALKRGKIAAEDSHEQIVSGIAAELEEFRVATDAPSEHLPEYSEVQEELADILICCLTELRRERVGIKRLLERKIEFNKNRV